MQDAEFEQFWSIYPRKVARAHAHKMWKRLTPPEKNAALAAIPLHVRYWEVTGRQLERIPHAGSWLNPEDGRRWEDEIRMPEPRAQEWWRSGKGIEERARALGIAARPGESHEDLRARILAKQ